MLANRGGEEFFGRSRDQIIGKTAYEIFSKPEADAIAGRDRQLLERGRQQFFDDHPIHTPGKGDRYVATRRLIVRSPNGQPQYLLSVIEDITERRQAENELHRTREFLRTIIENVPAAIYVKELAEFRHILVNRAGEQFFGRPREEIIGKTLHDIFPRDAADTIMARDKQALQPDQDQIYGENPVHSTVNGWEKISVRRVVVKDANDNPQYLLTVIENRTEQRQAEARAAHLARHDALTDLPNRAAFNEHFESTLKRSAAANEGFALMSIDLDRFKEINDLFGHSVGDALLCEVSRRLQAAMGERIYRSTWRRRVRCDRCKQFPAGSCSRARRRAASRNGRGIRDRRPTYSRQPEHRRSGLSDRWNRRNHIARQRRRGALSCEGGWARHRALLSGGHGQAAARAARASP